MLRRILLAFPFLFFLSFSTASAEHWVQIEKPFTEDGITITRFVDIDSIKRQGDTATALIKISTKDSYAIAKKEYHKYSRIVSVLSFVYYYHSELSDKGSSSKAHPIKSGSYDEIVYDIIW